jgi:hypothetical protein
MDAQDQRILELEAEVLALTNSLGEVCRRLAAFSPRHHAAVHNGLDSASRTLSLAHGYALGADARHMFAYAVSCVDIHRQMALAPMEDAKAAHAPCGEPAPLTRSRLVPRIL